MELTEAWGVESLGGRWEMALTGPRTHGTDLPSSRLRQNRKSEGASDLEAEERCPYSTLLHAGQEDTAHSPKGAVPAPAEFTEQERGDRVQASSRTESDYRLCQRRAS